MENVRTDAFWRREFRVTAADLERIGGYIHSTGQAHDLTTLARRVIRGRVRHGPETSAPAQPTLARDPSVRLWDPAAEWRVGDHVIVARTVYSGTQYAFVGEVTAVEPNHVHMRLDGLAEPVTYMRAEPGSELARRWFEKVKEVAAGRWEAPNEATQTEAILLAHGQRVASQLLDALRADERFVALSGRWFLRDLAVLPSDEQLTALAQAMARLDGPRPTDRLVPLLQPPITKGEVGTFGLLLAMRQRSDLFANVGSAEDPRWRIVRPPTPLPRRLVPRHAAYDPKTYEILCLPGVPISTQVERRLRELDLLQAVQ